MSGTTTLLIDLSKLAPSTHAASSSSMGTESIKFLVIQIAIGKDDADMNSIVPIVESNMFIETNSAYTGTIRHEIGRQVPNSTEYRNGLLNLD